jgi:serine/threonine protein kinase
VGFSQWLKGLFSSGPKTTGGPKAKGSSKQPRVNVGKRFDLMGRTGQGSMSKVWRARDKQLGRVVCLKLLDKQKTAAFEARFKGLVRPNEGTICLGLRHKNVVQTFEHGMTTDGEQYLVMELIEGMGLNYLIETRSTQLQGNRINFLIQVADALEYVHGQGYLHRDICPRNIMATADGVVKLIDFGLAIPARGEFLRPGNRTGTPNYLAPEIIRRSATDSRVDMFALGVMTYEVFTNQLPWEKAQSLQTLLSHMNSPGRDPKELLPELDTPTRTFLMKCVERDREARYRTPGEFRDALRRLPKQDW